MGFQNIKNYRNWIHEQNLNYRHLKISCVVFYTHFILISLNSYTFLTSAPPGPPQNVQLSSITASSITVSWQPSPYSVQFGNVHYYTVNCSSHSHNGVNYTTADNSTVSVQVTELRPYTVYECCVGGVGVAGGSVLTCRTSVTSETGKVCVVCVRGRGRGV